MERYAFDRDQERLERLRAAREQKALHAQLKKDLRTAGIMEARAIAAHVLTVDFERFGSLPVAKLLGSIWAWGPDKVRRACQKAQVNQMARVKDLTPDGRERLSDLLTRAQSSGF